MEQSVRAVMAQMVVRIFEEGKGSNGSALGSYNNTTELYVDPSTLPRNISPRGKPGKEKDVKNRKTVYFKSYQALRSEVGREAGFVNLRLTNDLQSDWSNAEVGKGDNKVADSPKPQKIGALEYHIKLKRPINREKREGLEAKYGDIFKLTANEKKYYFDVLSKSIALQNA